ncbi:MAG: hypothetical protein WBW06_11960, partial [Xanthobacteraceae bacterium]
SQSQGSDAANQVSSRDGYSTHPAHIRFDIFLARSRSGVGNPALSALAKRDPVGLNIRYQKRRHGQSRRGGKKILVMSQMGRGRLR